MSAKERPLAGIKVIEFTHMVMGPAIGVILADLGAAVVKVEPLKGDNTRRLQGSGAGYFAMYNRNKKSLCIDTKSAAGKAAVLRLLAGADVVVENFRPGGMEEQGLGYAELSATNPGLVYCSAKGFLRGPYEKRTALDEVAQMMGGLAYMTGLPERPMRAGASVIDVTGAMFGVIAVLAALEERHRTGKGCHVKASLYETTAFLVGQHMAQFSVTGKAPPPMSVRQSAWAVYDIFETSDEEKVFVAVVSDTQWRKFCEAFSLEEFIADRSLDTNTERVKQKERVHAALRPLFAQFTKSDLMAKLELIGLPFAPIAKPGDLFDDVHLNAGGGLVPVTLPSGAKTKLPALPVEIGDWRPDLHHDLPLEGRDTREVLEGAGYGEDEIATMVREGVIRMAAGV